MPGYYNTAVPEGDYDRRYLDQELRKISDVTILLEEVITNLVPAGYGGMKLGTPVSFDIVAAFTTVPFDINFPVASRGMTFDLANETFTFTKKGVWQVMFNFALEGHNSDNGGRNFGMRLWNVTNGAPASDVIQQGIGRNETYSLVGITFLTEISQAVVDAGDAFRFEIGGGDSATGGTLNTALGQFVHASEFGLLV